MISLSRFTGLWILGFVLFIQVPSALSGEGHGAGNGGDPREVYLHNRQQLLMDYLMEPEALGAAGLDPASRDELIRAAAQVHYRVSDRDVGCVVKDSKHPVIWVSLAPSCFDALVGGGSESYARLTQVIVDSFIPEDRRTDALRNLSAHLSRTDLTGIDAYRKFIRHPTCQLGAVGSLGRKSVRESVAATLKARGYELVRADEPGALRLEAREDLLLLRLSSLRSRKELDEPLWVARSEMQMGILSVLSQMNRMPWCLKDERP